MWGLQHLLRKQNLKRTVVEHIKEHTAKIVDNLSAIAEHYQKTTQQDYYGLQGSTLLHSYCTSTYTEVTVP